MTEHSDPGPGGYPATLVDTCVLLDVLVEDQRHHDWSASKLAEAADTGPLVINPLIYAEVSIRFSHIEELDAALPPADFRRDPLPYEAGFLAGKAFLRYRRSGGHREAPLPDFYIGAHAAVRGFRLLTRDRRRFATYFPTVQLIAPA